MTKPLHAGLAAKNGVLAARLAARGFTASPATLEEGKGVFDCFARGLDCDVTPFESLGTTYDLAGIGISVKPYPCGGLTHTAVDAVLDLRREGIHADQLDTLTVGVTPHVFDRIMRALPKNGIEGKFSMPYIVARALVDGQLVLDTFTDEAVREPDVRRVAEKIEMVLDPTLEETAAGGRPAKVRAKLKDGRVLSRQQDFARGTPAKPMTDEELRSKFDACASRVLAPEQVQETASLIARLEDVDDVGKLCRLLNP
jgi:2-methylcitrate dehydratase PrpD